MSRRAAGQLDSQLDHLLRDSNRLTIVDALGDGLQDLDVDGRDAPVVAVVVVLSTALDPCGPPLRAQLQRRLTRDGRHDAVHVEAQDRRVGVDVVIVEQLW